MRIETADDIRQALTRIDTELEVILYACNNPNIHAKSVDMTPLTKGTNLTFMTNNIERAKESLRDARSISYL